MASWGGVGCEYLSLNWGSLGVGGSDWVQIKSNQTPKEYRGVGYQDHHFQNGQAEVKIGCKAPVQQTGLLISYPSRDSIKMIIKE